MNSPATEKIISRKLFVYFRIIFALTWLIYDVIDFSFNQTIKTLWIFRAPVAPLAITASQAILIICELLLLLGWQSRMMAFAAFLARGYVAFLFPLNDYLYFCVIALILSQSPCEGGLSISSVESSPARPRNIFILQTAWIYFASALLKMNPAFLSGGDLYVRQNYEAAVLPFYYPAFYLNFISSLSNNSILAWTAVILEMLLAFTLFYWWICKNDVTRKWLRRLAILLCCAIHGYAAYNLNVFFFGISMVAQVMIFTRYAVPFPEK